MPTLRSDAARSRARILQAARTIAPDDLRLNDLARATGLGVGTVYRHFPTVAALLEALNVDALEQLVELARAAVQAPSPGEAFLGLVRDGAALQLERDGLQAVLTAPDASDQVVRLREELTRLVGVALAAAVAEGRVRPDVTVEHLQRLVCGVEHAVRLGAGRDRDLLLDIVLDGLGSGAEHRRSARAGG